MQKLTPSPSQTAARYWRTEIGKAKVGDMLPFLQLISAQWNLSITRDFGVIQKILYNSVQNN